MNYNVLIETSIDFRSNKLFDYGRNFSMSEFDCDRKAVLLGSES